MKSYMKKIYRSFFKRPRETDSLLVIQKLYNIQDNNKQLSFFISYFGDNKDIRDGKTTVAIAERIQCPT